MSSPGHHRLPAPQREAVDEAFQQLDERLDPDESAQRAIDRTKSELLAELAAVTPEGSNRAVDEGPRNRSEDGQEGRPPGRTDGGTAARSAQSPERTESFPVGFRTVLDRIGTTLFVLDAEGNVVHWNEAATNLTGVTVEEAKAVDMAGEAFYHDGRRSKTLADKVLDAPQSADSEHDLPRVDEYEFPLYRDRSTMTNADGESVNISFSAAPLYDGDELVGVVEMVQDRTEEVRRRERTTDLVDELKTTLEAIKRGEYEARASFEHRGYVDERLLPVVDELNDLADEFQSLATHVTHQADELHAETESVASTSGEISDLANDQRETMRTLAEEVADLSATIEEIAATATQANDTSDRAATLADDGQDAAEHAIEELRSVTGEVEAVAAEVDSLQDRIDEISEAVEVIDNIAEETNILALNAAIEAARTDGGEGFAVVADEVKRLAGDSQENAADIEALVEEIQADAEATVEDVEATSEDVAVATQTVEDALSNLEGIADSTQSTANSIREVADATDEQAKSTETLAEMIDEARDRTERIASDIESIADANTEQREKSQELTVAIEEHTF